MFCLHTIIGVNKVFIISFLYLSGLSSISGGSLRFYCQSTRDSFLFLYLGAEQAHTIWQQCGEDIFGQLFPVRSLPLETVIILAFLFIYIYCNWFVVLKITWLHQFSVSKVGRSRRIFHSCSYTGELKILFVMGKVVSIYLACLI